MMMNKLALCILLAFASCAAVYPVTPSAREIVQNEKNEEIRVALIKLYGALSSRGRELNHNMFFEYQWDVNVAIWAEKAYGFGLIDSSLDTEINDYIFCKLGYWRSEIPLNFFSNYMKERHKAKILAFAQNHMHNKFKNSQTNNPDAVVPQNKEIHANYYSMPPSINSWYSKNIDPDILYDMAMTEINPLEFEAIWFRMQDSTSPKMIPYMIKAMQDGKFKEEKSFDPIDAFLWLRDHVPLVYRFESNLFMKDIKYRLKIAQLYQEWYSNIPNKSLLKFNKKRRLFLTGEESRLELDIYSEWRRMGAFFSNMNTKYAVVAKMSHKYLVNADTLKNNFKYLINNQEISSIIYYISKFPSTIPLIYDFDEESLSQNQEYISNIASMYQRWYSDNKETITYNKDLQVFLTGKETDKEISDFLEWRKSVPSREVIRLNYDMCRMDSEKVIFYRLERIPISVEFNLEKWNNSKKYKSAISETLLSKWQLWYSNNKGKITYNEELKLFLTGTEAEEEIKDYLKWRDRYIGFVQDY
jgi:hypothetical protein